MTTVYTSEPQLRRTGEFFSAAADDLRRSPAIAWRLFRSNVRARYRRAWLGYLWLLLPTLGTTALWVYVKSRGIVNIAPTAVPYPLYVLSGMVLWQVFTESLNAPLQQLTAARQVITRSRVPHEALVLAGLYEVVLQCIVRLSVLAIALAAFAMPIGVEVLLVPLGIAALALLGLTLGLFAAPIGLLYDDVSRALTLVTGFWFFLTPVLYRTPPRGILRLNPVTPLLDTTRAWLMSSGPATSSFLIVAFFSLVALVVAWLFFRLARPHVVARLG